MFAPVVTLHLATSNQIKFGSHEKEKYIDQWRHTRRHSKKKRKKEKKTRIPNI